MATGKTWDEMLKDLELQLNTTNNSSSLSSTGSQISNSGSTSTPAPVPISISTTIPLTTNETTTTPSSEPTITSPSKKSDKKKRSKDKDKDNNSSLLKSTTNETLIPNSSTPSISNNTLLLTPKAENNPDLTSKTNTIGSDPLGMKTPELILTKEINNNNNTSEPSSSLLTDSEIPSSSSLPNNTTYNNISTPNNTTSTPSSNTVSSSLSPTQQPVLLTGAVAHALADAVAKAVSRVDKWQKKSEAQDKVITRLRQEMIKAGITLPALLTATDDDIPLESTKSTDDTTTNLPSTSPAPTTPSLPTSSPLSGNKTRESNSSIPSSVTLKLGPNAVNLLKQAGFGTNNNSLLNKTPSSSPSNTNQPGIVANSNVDANPIPPSFPFTSSLVTAVALAHAGHPDRLCAETAASGTLARQLRIEVQLLRSVIEQLRIEHQKRMKAQTTIIDQLRDRIHELEHRSNPTDARLNRRSPNPTSTKSSSSPSRSQQPSLFHQNNISPIPSSNSVTLHTPNMNQDYTTESNDISENNNALNEPALWQSILNNQQANNNEYNPSDNDDDIDNSNSSSNFNDTTPRRTLPTTDYYPQRKSNNDRMEMDELTNPPINRGRSGKPLSTPHTNNHYQSAYKQDPTNNRARSASNRRQAGRDETKTPSRNRPVSAGPLGRSTGRTSRLSNPVPPRTPGGGLSFTAGLHPPQATSPPTVLRRGTGLGAGGALLRGKSGHQQGMSDELKAAILGKPTNITTTNNNSSSSTTNPKSILRNRSQSRGASNSNRNRTSVGPNNHPRYTGGNPQGGTFAKASGHPSPSNPSNKNSNNSHPIEKRSPTVNTAAATAAAAERIKNYKRTHHQVLPVIKLLNPPNQKNAAGTVPNRPSISPPPLSYSSINNKLTDAQIEFNDSFGVTAISNKRALHIDSASSSENNSGSNSVNAPSKEIKNNYTIPPSLLAILDNLTKSK